MKKTIAISVTEGRVVRDLFHNGMLDLLIERGHEVLILSPAARVPDFVKRWQRSEVHILPLVPHKLSRQEERLLAIRRQAMRLGGTALGIWLQVEKKLWRPDPGVIELLKEHDCRAAVITHPMYHAEMGLFAAARRLGLPTLGILRSWDNLYKGLRIRPDILAVWNPVNQKEAIDWMKLPADQVKIVGGTQFDPYFAQDSAWSRAQLAGILDLDPSRPILTLATLGAFLHQYDETYLVDVILQAIEQGTIPGRPQLVIRLHPASRLEYFSRYENLKDVRLSVIRDYIPTLEWTMTREDVILVSNLLRHSDVIVSPGSTITIEGAIFDTPTVVPVFHTYQPELGHEQYQHHLSKHFKRLNDLDLVPIVREPSELVEAVGRALKDRTWYQAERRQLVQDYIHFTDGRSTQRLADLISSMVR